ncbi:MAG: type II secretion system protein GspG [FCB group bacterium]|jgi:general secretion pathway protein G|nr:type II secretion system protein GspG [FCB group bacterium]
MQRNSGFTLIELILVTVIIGILAGSVALNVKGRVTQAGTARAKGDIATYETAIDTYALDHQDKLPKTLKDLTSGERTYVRIIKKDPWGQDYIYKNPGTHMKNGYDLYSKGPDKVAGNDDDIVNWDDGSQDDQK